MSLISIQQLRFVLVICGFVVLLSSALCIAAPTNCAPNLDYLLSDDFYEQDAIQGCANDPFESFNRTMFTFNDKLYIWVLDPVTTTYKSVVPADFRTCVKNFFSNLESPIRFFNSLLQGRFDNGYKVLQRFLINSTVGVFGFGDPAEVEFDISPVDAHLGQTLAAWGVDYGFYLYIPFFGPSTVREFSGTVVDSLYMVPYYMWIDDWYAKGGIYSGKQMNELSFHLGEYEDIKALTLDPYIAVRNAYFQYQAKKNAQKPDESYLLQEDVSNGIQ